ncbi:MAG: hypothetical protein JOZ75_10980 [Candidatus Dormibacteraeota bacterium]|nr:hypothetical protein [Candidatus Dormibacteraeota bacterium]
MRLPAAALRWGAGDQALSSVTNFAILVVVARSAGPVDLGVFAIFTAGYSTVTYVNESLVSEPFIVRHTAIAREAWRARVREATAASVALGALCSLALLISAFIAGGTLGGLLLLGAVCAPALLVQDTIRFAFFAAGRQRTAFCNDLLWGVLQLAGYLIVHATHTHSLVAVVATWAGAGAVAGCAGLWQARALPQMSRTVAWLRAHHDLWRFILLERLSGQGAMYLSLVGIGAFAGLSAVAAVRAAQSLFGPLYITLNAVRIVMLPSLVATSGDRRRRRVHMTVLFTVLIAAACGAVITFLPGPVGRALFGATWPLVAPLLLFVSLSRITGSAAEAWRLGLLSGASVRRSLAARVALATALIIGTAAGAALAGARGAVVAEAIVFPLGAALFFRQFLVSTRSTSAGARMRALLVDAEMLG